MTTPIVTIKRISNVQVQCDISGGGIDITDSWGLGVWDYWSCVFAPTYHERVIIPKLYKKANAWAATVIANHQKGTR